MRALALAKCLPILLGLGSILLPAVFCGPVERRDAISDMAKDLNNLADTLQEDVSQLGGLLDQVAIGKATQAVINDLNLIGKETSATREAILANKQLLPDATSDAILTYGDSVFKSLTDLSSDNTLARCVLLLGTKVVEALKGVQSGNEGVFKALIGKMNNTSVDYDDLIKSADAIQEALNLSANLAIKNYAGTCITTAA